MADRRFQRFSASRLYHSLSFTKKLHWLVNKLKPLTLPYFSTYRDIVIHLLLFITRKCAIILRETATSREAWSGGNDLISVGWHSVIRKDHPLVGIHISIFVLARTRKKPKRAAFITIHQQLDRWSRPRWSHTWRYTPLPVAPYHEYMYWPPSKWWMYSLSRRQTQIAQYSVVL